MPSLSQAFFETLLRTQHFSAEQMQAYQRDLLERLVRHARVRVPFYRDSGRLDALFADDQLDWSRWQDVPVLTRREAQRHAASLYAEDVPAECGKVTSGYTAGSTGTPLAYRINGLMAVVGSAMLERGFVWAGLPEHLSLAWFRNDREGSAAYPDGKTYRSMMRGAPRTMHHLAVQTPMADQGRWLARVRPDVVMGYPGALALLAEELPRELDDHRFGLAICVGEVTTEQSRAAIEQGFRCPVMDLYSGSEFGPIAVEDRALRRHFICEEATFVEFRESRDFAEAGISELIFTPLYNYAMPLIRYATGDFAEVDAGPPPDRRTLRRLVRIAGRDRNYFILPSGKRWWPTYQNKILRDYLDYQQIQFAQTAPNRIEIRYASELSEPVMDAARLNDYLRATTPEAMEIAVVRVEGIAQRVSGKYEYVACEIDQPAAS